MSTARAMSDMLFPRSSNSRADRCLGESAFSPVGHFRTLSDTAVTFACDAEVWSAAIRSIVGSLLFMVASFDDVRKLWLLLLLLQFLLLLRLVAGADGLHLVHQLLRP